MIDHVGRELAGRGFRLHAGDELAPWSAHHLNLDFGEALVEGLDHLLLDLREVRGVVDEPALLLGGGDQLGRTEILRDRRHCEHARKAERGQDRFHGDVPPVVLMRIIPRGQRWCSCCRRSYCRETATWRRRSAPRAALSAPG